MAALALGYYSYDATSRMAEKTEESLEEGNKVMGQKLLDRLEWSEEEAGAVH